MFDRLEGYSVQQTHRQVREEEPRVWKEKLRQAETQCQQAEAVLQERIQLLEQALRNRAFKLWRMPGSAIGYSIRRPADRFD
ncbi:MAG: hypothetical protein LBJ41_08685 [Treponema sp.]|nr:hypothetical protein [Treponema sp.]